VALRAVTQAAGSRADIGPAAGLFTARADDGRHEAIRDTKVTDGGKAGLVESKRSKRQLISAGAVRSGSFCSKPLQRRLLGAGTVVHCREHDR
jgi:hypothetical protein